jgi:hypothetical protein
VRIDLICFFRVKLYFATFWGDGFKLRGGRRSGGKIKLLAVDFVGIRD